MPREEARERKKTKKKGAGFKSKVQTRKKLREVVYPSQRIERVIYCTPFEKGPAFVVTSIRYGNVTPITIDRFDRCYWLVLLCHSWYVIICLIFCLICVCHFNLFTTQPITSLPHTHPLPIYLPYQYITHYCYCNYCLYHRITLASQPAQRSLLCSSLHICAILC
jgi:hypothetical protein